MLPRSIFIISIRLFALFWYVNYLFSDIPFFYSMIQLGQANASIAGALASLVVATLILAAVVIFTPNLVDLLGLSRSIEVSSELEQKVNIDKALHISLVVLGFYFALNTLPDLIVYTFNSFRNEVGTLIEEPYQLSPGAWFSLILEFILSLVLIFNAGFIVRKLGIAAENADEDV